MGTRILTAGVSDTGILHPVKAIGFLGLAGGLFALASVTAPTANAATAVAPLAAEPAIASITTSTSAAALVTAQDRRARGNRTGRRANRGYRARGPRARGSRARGPRVQNRRYQGPRYRNQRRGVVAPRYRGRAINRSRIGRSRIARQRYLGPRFVGPRYGAFGPGFFPGRFYGTRAYYPGFRTGFFYGGPGFFYGGRFYRRGLRAGDVALLTAGVLGGAILIDRAFDSYNDDRINDNRFRSNNSVGSSIPSLNGRPLPPNDFGDDDRRLDEDFERDEFPPLEGEGDISTEDIYIGPLDGNYRTAYRQCTDALRSQFASSNVALDVPSEPLSGGAIGDGVWRMEGEVVVRTRDGASYLKTLTCEADTVEVGYLEIT